MEPLIAKHRTPAREGGYNLAVLLVVVAVINIGLAAILPAWRTQIQREKEKEAVFRGLQYAEAIRLFQKRHGRLPVKIEELVEVRPRSIRKLWPNPLSADGSWGFVFATGASTPGQEGDGGRAARRARRRNRQRAGAQPVLQNGGANDPTAAETGAVGPNGQPQANVRGPIAGVYPKGSGSPILAFRGATTYAEWRFTPEILPRPVLLPHLGTIARAHSGDVGKPFRFALTPQGRSGPQGSTELPGGSAPQRVFDRGEEPDS